MPASVYRLSPSLLAILLKRSRNGAVCYTCGKPLELSDIIVSKFAKASHRNFRHARCAVLKGIVDESDIEKGLRCQSSLV